MNITLENINIRYKDTGRGDPVLLLHGWGASMESWGNTQCTLSEEHRVVALDFPGHGGSGEPLSPWSVQDYVDLVCSFMDALNIRQCGIVAHSFGGRVSIKLAAQQPERVRRMILCDAAGVKPKRTLKYHVKVRSFKIMKFFSKREWVQRMLRAFGIDIVSKINSVGSEDYKKLSGVMKQTFVRVVNEDLTPHLKHIACPTLLYWGEADQDTPLWQARVMEKEIPDAALITVPGGSHFSYLDDYRRFIAVVQVFLRR